MGEYKNDKKHGAGYYKWKDGTAFEGTFKNDWQDKGTKKYPDGVISTYEGVWTRYDTKFTGTVTYADGSIFEGEDRSGKLKGKLTYLDHRFEGLWETKKNRYMRTGVLYYDNGDRYEGSQYKKDGIWLKDGKGKMTTAGETVIGIWKDDELVKEQKRTVNKTE
ncbi:MAG: hypothetical protein LBJ63_04145 [Prevotellaceae bacterium]|jgi:hypothetical protein|nr:hypothetical protein [Prevotellaceae bacterium]